MYIHTVKRGSRDAIELPRNQPAKADVCIKGRLIFEIVYMTFF